MNKVIKLYQAFWSNFTEHFDQPNFHNMNLVYIHQLKKQFELENKVKVTAIS